MGWAMRGQYGDRPTGVPWWSWVTRVGAIDVTQQGLHDGTTHEVGVAQGATRVVLLCIKLETMVWGHGGMNT